MSETRVVVVGGGLAGITAALSCADSGARVTLIERRPHLGGLTRSFRHGDWTFDNGQHVFLRCCTAYLDLLERIGASSEVTMQDRLDLPVVKPGGPTSRIRRQARLPAPLHLAGSLVRYRHLPVTDRLKLGWAVLPLSRLDLDDPALDGVTFGHWLEAHGQSPRAIAALWDLITIPTVNLPAAEASLAVAAKVFQTGLLTDPTAADIGWSAIPLGRLHGERGENALRGAGAEILTGERVTAIDEGAGFTVRTEHHDIEADAVVVALPHDALPAILPPGALADAGRSERSRHVIGGQRARRLRPQGHRPHHGRRDRHARAVLLRPDRQRRGGDTASTWPCPCRPPINCCPPRPTI